MMTSRKIINLKKKADETDGKSDHADTKGSKHGGKKNENKNDEDDFDWRSFVPPAYRIYIPSEETIKEANKNNTEDKPVDWTGFVPEPFRHFTAPQAQPYNPSGNQPSPSSDKIKDETQRKKDEEENQKKT